jgi:hypothetical protein
MARRGGAQLPRSPARGAPAAAAASACCECDPQPCSAKDDPSHQYPTSSGSAVGSSKSCGRPRVRRVREEGRRSRPGTRTIRLWLQASGESTEVEVDGGAARGRLTPVVVRPQAPMHLRRLRLPAGKGGTRVQPVRDRRRRGGRGRVGRREGRRARRSRRPSPVLSHSCQLDPSAAIALHCFLAARHPTGEGEAIVGCSSRSPRNSPKDLSAGLALHGDRDELTVSLLPRRSREALRGAARSVEADRSRRHPWEEQGGGPPTRPPTRRPSPLLETAAPSMAAYLARSASSPR